MKFKGTKGKWKYTEYMSLYPVINERGDDLCDSDNFELEAKYNALLMSKAPEMLEMLIKCTNTFNGKFPSLQTKIEQLIKEATEI